MNSFRNSSIRDKLVIIIVSVTFSLTAVALITVGTVDYQLKKKDLLNNGTLQATLVAEYVTVALDFEDVEWAQHVIEKLSAVPDAIECHIYKQDGSLFADYHKPGVLHTTTSFSDIEDNTIIDNSFYILETVVQDNIEIGTVFLRISTDRLQRSIVAYFCLISMVLLLIFILSIVIALKLQKYISRPIVNLANKAHQISDKQTFKMTITYDSDDEIGELYREFDQMLSTINDRDIELQKARSYLNNVIDSMPSILIGVDAKGEITSMNKMAEEISSTSREDAEGQPVEKIFQNYAKYLSDVISAITNQKPVVKSKIDDTISESTRLVDLTAYPLTGGSVNGAMIRIDDVTDRVRMEEMMVQTEKMMSVGGLAAGMAHEINNPLGIIAQGAQNILQKTKPDLKANIRTAENVGITMEALQEYFESRQIYAFIQDIRDATARASSIAKNILNFSRKSDNLKSSVNIQELIENTIELVGTDFDLKKEYDFKSIEIERHYDNTLPLITLSETEIEQVLINLFKNGAQAMAEVMDRKHKFIITVTADREWVIIKLQDSGPGIPEKIRNRIFEPFFTTKPIGIGTGLGLSVSYMIIHNNHSGQLSVNSIEGEGTEFTIKLPVQVVI